MLHYSSSGTRQANEFQCPAGSYSDRSGNVRIQDCFECIAGHYCPAGSVLPTACLPGTYSDALGAQVLCNNVLYKC